METFDAGAKGFFVLATADKKNRFGQSVALAGRDRAAIEQGRAAFFDGPRFPDHRIVNDANDDFTCDAEGDGNAEMGDAVKEIHGAVDGIDDPLAG